MVKHGSRDDSRHIRFISTSTVSLGDGEHHSCVEHAEEYAHFTVALVGKDSLQRRRKCDASLDGTGDVASSRGVGQSDIVPRGNIS